MKTRSIGEKLVYVFILLGLLGNGLLQLHYLLDEPNPARFVPWLGILFCGLPFLCVLGVFAFVPARAWRLPRLLGVSVLVYAGGFLAVSHVVASLRRS